jgi:putative ABC transport system permease protein
MTPLHRKLIRELIHMRGQIIAITLVLACGVATYVTMRSAFVSLEAAQAEYYSSYRFADVFTHVKRAPESIYASISAMPGVAAVQTRVVMDVTLDVPGLDEPTTGRLISIPEHRTPMLNDIFLREGVTLSRASAAKCSSVKRSLPRIALAWATRLMRS